MTENKMLKHRVLIDKYTTIELMIPEDLTAADFEGMMLKAKKMFNLSDSGFSMPKPQKVSQQNEYPSLHRKARKSTTIVRWSNEMRDILLKEGVTEESLKKLKSFNGNVTKEKAKVMRDYIINNRYRKKRK